MESKTSSQLPPTSSLLLQPENQTDVENGRRFARVHGVNVRYVATWGQWLVWDGKRWAVDERLAIEGLAKQTTDGIWDEIRDCLPRDQQPAKALVAWGKYSASAHGTANMLAKARSEPEICITHNVLDSNPWLLNLENGTFDLRAGRFRAHSKEDLITKVSPVAYERDAECPRWRQFLQEIMADDEELIRFLRRLCGYWLTGSVQDQVLPIFYGEGANGKSVFLNVVQALLGPDYAMKAPAGFLAAKKHASHPTELADVCGKRLVAAIEVESNHRLAEALVKELTGGDRIRARHMREDFWEFEPTHKLVLAANHKPGVEGMDNGIWRRVRLVPFNVVFPKNKQDPRLAEKLMAELPGILNWMLLGYAEWLADGLGEPSAVTEATAGYRTECDSIMGFISDCCIVGPQCSARAGSLHESYRNWCAQNGYSAHNSTVFGVELGRRGYDVVKKKCGKVRLGIGLAASEATAGDQL